MSALKKCKAILSLALLLGFFFSLAWPQARLKKALTFQDMMRFRTIKNPSISEDGLWVAYTAQPDRGDGQVIVQSTQIEKTLTVERGSQPVFSNDGKWAAMALRPKAIDLEKAEKDKPKPGLALLEISSGKVIAADKVEHFAFSDDSAWLAYRHFKEEEKKEQKENPQEPKAAADAEKEPKIEVGSTLVLRRLATTQEIHVPFVLSFAFDKSSRYLAYAVAAPEGKGNGLFRRELTGPEFPEKVIVAADKTSFTNLAWSKDESVLAFLSSLPDDKGGSGPASLKLWFSKTGKILDALKPEAVPEGWIIPAKNELSWTKDGQRLFFGLRPEEEKNAEQAEKKDNAPQSETGAQTEEALDLFSIDQILEKREIDVWHWNDPRIIPHQKKAWERFKDHTFRAVYHLRSGQLVALADREMPNVGISENPRFTLGFSDVPFLKELTWDGAYSDVYLVNLSDGSRRKIVARLPGQAFLSPQGNYAAYYQDKHWYLFETQSGKTRNITMELDVPFFDDEDDHPGSPPGFGLAGWVEGDSAVLINDKYDIWQFPAAQGKPTNIIGGEGRKNDVTFRVLRLDPEKRFMAKDESLLLSAYHNREKYYGFYVGRVGSSSVEKRLEEKKQFTFLGKAKKADMLIYTRESYEEFPDIWTSDMSFASPRKLSEVNPQIAEFAWGSAELVEWQSLDGVPLQGVLIKPGDYEPGKRYPVLVYFYELFSQRLYEFNEVVVNHRPCFPFYASNGYALFLPDIRYTVGFPGFSATKCLVPGVQKLIDLGIADPKKIALHGHSWSGYETAFIITQTNLFAAAIAGAAVSNMTSAYSGIRWESGMARQFQYEKDQSRIGGSLWEYPERYIENSPVFFADRIQTPLLLMFGDEDGAVPWYQGIEFYLAMRRLGKDCIFLQYRGEPHHPQKYPNKLDYSIRMKQYLDHYLKGEPAAEWIARGVPYSGK
jgi:dipeptidyl aminopeptidase/acylaminoacyl peptidase